MQYISSEFFKIVSISPNLLVLLGLNETNTAKPMSKLVSITSFVIRQSVPFEQKVPYQLLPNTADTDLHVIKNFLLIKCTLNQRVSDIKLTGKPYLALSGTIRNRVSGKICCPVSSGIRLNLISGYIRYPVKKVYPVHP